MNFGRPFGAPIPGRPKDVQQAISVIVTPRGNGVPVVAVVTDVDSHGFSFRLRNADPNRHAVNLSIDWLAVLGVPDQNPTAAQLLDGRFVRLQPQQLDGFSVPWPRIWFDRPLARSPAGEPAVLVISQTDLHCNQNSNPAAVGVALALTGADDLLNRGIIDAADHGFSLSAANVDTVSGHVAFNGAAFTDTGRAEGGDDGPGLTQLWFDHGSEHNVDRFFQDAVFPGTPYPVSRGGQSGDWRTVDIYFDRPFLVPPIVLATGRGRTPLVCVVRKVSTHGFTLSSRNIDTVDGHALFFWAAIGTPALPV